LPASASPRGAAPKPGGRPLGAAPARPVAAPPGLAAPGGVRPPRPHDTLHVAAPGVVRPPDVSHASAPGARPPGGATARLQGTPSAAASLLAVGARADAGALPADAAADATGALTGVDALAVDVGPGAMAAGAVAAMAAGLGMPAGANDTLLRFTALPPASHLHSVAALVAARTTVAEGMARVREAAIAWERERDVADALARQVAEAKQILGIPASPDVEATSSAGSRVAHTTAAGPRMAHTADGTLQPRALATMPGDSQVSPVPSSVREALLEPHRRHAMEEEYAALHANQTWDLIPRPPGSNIVTGKWI